VRPSAKLSEYITVLRSAVVRFQGLAFDSIAKNLRRDGPPQNEPEQGSTQFG
jgi:hypothetical protein